MKHLSPVLLKKLTSTGIFIILLFSSLQLSAQTDTLKGTVLETFSGNSLPFVHITVNDSVDYLSDIDGNFFIPDKASLWKITFELYMHRPVTLYPPFENDLIVRLNKFIFFEISKESDPVAPVIIRNVIDHKDQNNPEKMHYYSYKTYNKFSLKTTEVEKSNKFLSHIFKKFSLSFKKLKEEQHFILIETSSEKKFIDQLHQREELVGAKSSGIDLPLLMVQANQVQNASLYKDYLNIAGKSYPSPLNRDVFYRYAFNLIDTIYPQNDTVFVIKFNPKSDRYFDGLKGIVYINKNSYALQHLNVSPYQQKGKAEINLLQSYQFYADKVTWFPARTKTVIVFSKGTEKYIANGNSYIYDVNLNEFLNKKAFNEVILNYSENANQKDEQYWRIVRREPLTHADSITYYYFESFKYKKDIGNFLTFGEKIFYGELPFRKIDIDVNRLLTFNNVEGTRIGFGAHTNEKYSDKIKFGGYIGYGIRDEKFKYGADFTYKPFYDIPLSLNARFSYDLREAGANFYPYNRYQYSSEALRKFWLRILDLVLEQENSVLYHPFKNMDVMISLDNSQHKPTYDYVYKGTDSLKFNFTEFKFGFRYAFGEQYFNVLKRKYPLPTQYPVVSFIWQKGLKKGFSGDYSYNRFALKIEETFKVLFLGKTDIMLETGFITGEAPYMKLYNEKGSYKNTSVVFHNSFETMKFNEFLSNRYASLFFSHDFGKLFITKSITPSLWIINNMGIGALSNPQYHQEIPFKTMEKGYFEGGSFLDNVIVVNLAGLKVGFGAGLFLRYGPYALPRFGDNFVFKFATNFFL
jgi:hypothetical protein